MAQQNFFTIFEPYLSRVSFYVYVQTNLWLTKTVPNHLCAITHTKCSKVSTKILSYDKDTKYPSGKTSEIIKNVTHSY